MNFPEASAAMRASRATRRTIDREAGAFEEGGELLFGPDRCLRGGLSFISSSPPRVFHRWRRSHRAGAVSPGERKPRPWPIFLRAESRVARENLRHSAR